MTDKIIIDGVDVSGCCCYENGKCLWTKRYYENNIVPDCEKVKDCYYKQLKRTQNALQDIKEMVTKHYLQNKKQLVQNCDCLDNFMQKIEDKCGEVM